MLSKCYRDLALVLRHDLKVRHYHTRDVFVIFAVSPLFDSLIPRLVQNQTTKATSGVSRHAWNIVHICSFASSSIWQELLPNVGYFNALIWLRASSKRPTLSIPNKSILKFCFKCILVIVVICNLFGLLHCSK